MKRFLCLLCCVSLLTIACQRGTLLHSFQPIPHETWGMRDTLSFDVDSLGAKNAKLFVCLRLTHQYLFRSMWVVVERSGKKCPLQRDSIHIPVMTDDGTSMGAGVNLIQIEHPVGSIVCNDSLRLRLYPIMRREQLPGVCDVGVKVIAN